MSFNTQITKNRVVEIVDSCMGSSKSTNAFYANSVRSLRKQLKDTYLKYDEFEGD